jgi:hypothetical protein
MRKCQGILQRDVGRCKELKPEDEKYEINQNDTFL